METIKKLVGDLKPYERNAKKHDETQIKNVMESIKQFGFVQPIVIDKDNVVIIGHCRLIAAKRLQMREVDCVVADNLTQEQVDKLRLLDNKLNESEWDIDLLLEDIPELDFSDFDIDWGLPDEEPEQTEHITLTDKFIVPPFSVLDTKQGYWQDRKKAWNAIINDYGKAREGGNKLFESRNNFSQKVAKQNGRNHRYTSESSLLDPVLCEVLLTWFMPKDGTKSFDCFAGDTAFGFVSGKLGYSFSGTELREEQAAFNQNACDSEGFDCHYYCDDGRNIQSHIPLESQDMFFSCPPYYNMEVYSDKENDASNQATYEEFYAILDEAFTNAGACLKNDRFACVVCKDVRNKDGGYTCFPDDVIRTFTRNGFALYNRMVLLVQVGSDALLANRLMDRTRKVRSVHEEVLVFYKGDMKNIKEHFEEVECMNMEGVADES